VVVVEDIHLGVMRMQPEMLLFKCPMTFRKKIIKFTGLFLRKGMKQTEFIWYLKEVSSSGLKQITGALGFVKL
jgi:hypothetical protein